MLVSVEKTMWWPGGCKAMSPNPLTEHCNVVVVWILGRCWCALLETVRRHEDKRSKNKFSQLIRIVDWKTEPSSVLLLKAMAALYTRSVSLATWSFVYSEKNMHTVCNASYRQSVCRTNQLTCDHHRSDSLSGSWLMLQCLGPVKKMIPLKQGWDIYKRWSIKQSWVLLSNLGES